MHYTHSHRPAYAGCMHTRCMQRMMTATNYALHRQRYSALLLHKKCVYRNACRVYKFEGIVKVVLGWEFSCDACTYSQLSNSRMQSPVHKQPMCIVIVNICIEERLP